MSYGFLIKNANGSIVYGDNSKHYMYLGRARVYMNQWIKPLGLDAKENRLFMFTRNVVGEGFSSLVNVPPSGYPNYTEGRYIGFANQGGGPWSVVQPVVDYTKYMDVYVFGSYSYATPPSYGLAIYRNNNVLFHTKSPPLIVQDIITVSANSPAYIKPYKIGVPPVLAISRDWQNRRTGIVSDGSVRPLVIRMSNSLFSQSDYYAESYTIPTINTDYYDRYPNVI